MCVRRLAIGEFQTGTHLEPPARRVRHRLPGGEQHPYCLSFVVRPDHGIQDVHDLALGGSGLLDSTVHDHDIGADPHLDFLGGSLHRRGTKRESIHPRNPHTRSYAHASPEELSA